MRCVIIHYHEVALKGRNRSFFEQRLVQNLRIAVRDVGGKQVDALQGRIRVILSSETIGQTLSVDLNGCRAGNRRACV
jgi:tRNA uracil 4-sulfurtransferase